MRVGLFGGSFNPAHEGHAHVAETARRRLKLDRVIWLVSPQNPLKSNHETADLAERMAGARAHARGPGMIVSDLERRLGSAYTIDTVRALQAARPGAQWFLVIGQDQYAGFDTWQGWQELLARTTLAIAARPDAGTAVDPQLRAAAHAAVVLPMMDVSSTEIRRRVFSGLGITDLVPPAVASYIARHHLYQDPPQGDPAHGS